MPHNPAWLINKYPNDLKAQIRDLVEHGYVVTLQDKESAQLIRKRSFSCLFALLTGIVPYLCYYMWKRDYIVYLDLSSQKPDPNWEKNKPSQFKTFLKVAGIVVGALLVLGMISALFDSHPETKKDSVSQHATSTSVKK
jgi:hypothetical protein